MEASPLLLAQTHARKASKAETPVIAIEEHDHAAGQFAKAANDTSNSEAFRTLKLLEQHHEKLAQIIKFRTEHPSLQPRSVPDPTKALEKTSTPASQTPAPLQEKSPYRSESQSFPPAHRAPRDVSSSIASNLASARGIPSTRQRRSGQASSPILNQHNVEGKITAPPRRSRLVQPPSKDSQTTPNATSEKHSTSSQPSVSVDQPPASTKEAEASVAKPEESFNRFYSAFENVFSKLTAPLAFAGLPLNPDSDQTIPSIAENKPAATKTPPHVPPSPRTQRTRPKSRATASPEYSRLFSPAALNAIREEPGNTQLGAAESFYVVPTTGGTMPYANVLARHTGAAQPILSRDSTGLSEDMDEFVDARETPGPPSPLATRGKRGPVSTTSGKTLEELDLENNQLKTICDDLSRRLWQFEISSQMNSMALHQSIRAMKATDSPSAGGSGEVEATKELAARLKALESDMVSTKAENSKLRERVGKYQERYEMLKKGAKKLREGTTQKTDTE